MTTIFVTYTGDANTRFDREYYVSTHLPLVRDAWGPLGLVGIDGFFPTGYEAGVIAIAVLQFRDEAAVQAALASPRTPEVLGDVPKFSDVSPTLGRSAPL